MRRALLAFVIGLTVALVPAGGALSAAPASVVVNGQSDCAYAGKQVASLPAGSGTFYVWVNTGAPIADGTVFNLQRVPLSNGATGTNPPGALQPFSVAGSCPSGTWAVSGDILYGGLAAGQYAWLLYDATGTVLLGGDTIRFK